MRDCCHPRDRVALATVEADSCPPDFDEDFLRDLFRLARILHHAADYPEHLGSNPVVDGVERGQIASGYLAEQVRQFGAGFSRHLRIVRCSPTAA